MNVIPRKLLEMFSINELKYFCEKLKINIPFYRKSDLVTILKYYNFKSSNALKVAEEIRLCFKLADPETPRHIKDFVAVSSTSSIKWLENNAERLNRVKHILEAQK